MTEDPRHKLSLSAQLEDAQKSCCPCRLCGGAAVIKDAGPGFGYFIYCENSYATSNPSCLQAGVAIRAWAYACSELWNKLNKPVASRPAWPVKAKPLTRDECQTAVEAAREARILVALEPQHDALALVAAAYRDAAWPVKVKPLVWVHGAGFGKQEHSYADTELGTWCMTAYSGRGGRWAYTDPCGNDSEDDWLTRDECQTAVEAAREARIFAELETGQAAIEAPAQEPVLGSGSARDAAYEAHEKSCRYTLPGGHISHTWTAKSAFWQGWKDALAYATPADAQAALTAIERAAYERGVRDAADQFNDGGQLVNPRAVILALLTQETAHDDA